MFEQSLEHQSENYVTLAALAYAYGELNQPDEAIRAYKEAIEL